MINDDCWDDDGSLNDDLHRLTRLWPDWNPAALRRICYARKDLLEALPMHSGPEPDMIRCFELIDNYRESVVFNVLRQQREYIRLHPEATAGQVVDAVDPTVGYLWETTGREDR